MAEGSHVGRPSSWITVNVMLVGFIIGGLGLVLGPSWPLFWVGVAVTALGGVLALAVGIFSDVVVYAPRDITSSADSGPAGGTDGTDGTETEAGKSETGAGRHAAVSEAARGDAESARAAEAG